MWRDIRAFASTRGPHHWIAGALALTIPVVIALTFASDFRDAKDAPETIIYVESWPADRSIEETRKANAENTRLREEFEANKRAGFQRLQNSMNKIGL